ncbi:MAG TPA: hypothetical protein ENI51_07910 [Candidatus Atribacteria bacterium]|nr:hypothetical protein [Candidatus Atribacteria bacterium]
MSNEINEYEIQLSFLIEANNKQKALEKFKKEFGSEIIQKANFFEIFEWDNKEIEGLENEA